MPRGEAGDRRSACEQDPRPEPALTRVPLRGPISRSGSFPMTPLKHIVFGKPRDPTDPKVFHTISLVAFLAWVGLGADGLSSSSYGPDEAFRAIQGHEYLALYLALLTAITVGLISFAYSLLLEHFPSGGGGYVVATKLLGPKAGVVSGSALVVDYVLTVTVSVASGVDAIFSFLPHAWQSYKVPTDLAVLVLLLVLNLRGVKESIKILLPIFLVFLATHLLLILYGVLSHLGSIPRGPLQGPHRDGLGRLHHDLARLREPGLDRPPPHLPQGLLAGRRHLHGHRGRLQRRPDPARAAGGHGEEDHALHGALPGLHGGRHPALLPPLGRLARGGEDHERRAPRARLLLLDPGALPRGRLARHPHPRLRGRPALRGGPDGLHRRAPGPGQHGHRFVAAPPVRQPLASASSPSTASCSWGSPRAP